MGKSSSNRQPFGVADKDIAEIGDSLDNLSDNREAFGGSEKNEGGSLDNISDHRDPIRSARDKNNGESLGKCSHE